MRIIMRVFVLGATLALFGCDAPGVATQALAPSTLPVMLVRDVPGYPVDLPPEPPIDELELQVTAADGLAFIGMKPRLAPQTRETGFRPSLSTQAIQDALAEVRRLGADVLRYYDAVGIALIRVPAGALRAIYHSQVTDFVESGGLRVATGSGGLALASQWRRNARRQEGAANGMSEAVPWNVAQIRGPQAWPLATGTGARAMLIGHGIQRHEDNPDVPETNCGGLFGACAGDFVNGTWQMGAMLARQNGNGVVGVAHGLSASDVYVWRAIHADGATFDLSVYYTGLNEAINRGIKLVVVDIPHLEPFATEANLITQAWKSNIIVVADVGSTNDASSYRDAIYPASYKPVVGVSGVTTEGHFASNVPGCTNVRSSIYGPMVDLAAGFWALTTIVFVDGSFGYFDTRTQFGHCGTYMAAGNVAGVVALLQQQNPGWTGTEIVNRLLATASLSGNPSMQLGHGIPNAGAALGAPPPPPPPPPPSFSVSILGPTSIEVDAICTWSAGVSGGIEPYSYSWERNGLLVSQSDSYMGGMNGASSFSLRLTAADNSGSQGSAEINVAGDGVGQCLM